MALNDPRSVPYEFRTFALDGVAWLYDESERQYPCTATPHIYAEPLYWLDRDCDEILPDPGLFLASTVERLERPLIDGLDPEDIAPDAEETAAWDTAREEANANCRI